MHKSGGIPGLGCGILYGVALPSRNEIRLGGFVMVTFVSESPLFASPISEYASLVRKSYSVGSL